MRLKLFLFSLAALLTACAPSTPLVLPTLVPTHTPRPTATPVLETPTPLIGSGGPGRATPSVTPTLSGSPTPLIAFTPTPTPVSAFAPLAFVPVGEFEMGAAPGLDPFAEQWERPVHTVTLSAFWMEIYEVSNARYALCVAAGACSPPEAFTARTRENYYSDPQFGDYPVVNVNHAQAQAYCAWMGGRLPTEAEWEYAARFNDGRRYPWGGGEADLGLGNFGNPDGDTQPVTSYPIGASALGALNLAGNVWEWAADWYDPEYYGESPAQNPTGPTTGTERVARGGAFATDPQFVRTTNRYARDPGRGYNNVGFRCVTASPPGGAALLPTLTPTP
jgi:formylglycine-generating enzyme required for sulfatase activity